MIINISIEKKYKYKVQFNIIIINIKYFSFFENRIIFIMHWEFSDDSILFMEYFHNKIIPFAFYNKSYLGIILL